MESRLLQWNDLKCPLQRAIGDLFREEETLFKVGVHQRTYCAKWAGFLQIRLRAHLETVCCQAGRSSWPRIDVDVEYNRALEETKKQPTKDDRPRFDRFRDGLVVFPDLIAHRRLKMTANLCVIEVRDGGEVCGRKRDSNPEDVFKDYWKLVGFQEFLEYEYSLFIGFVVELKRPDIGEAWLLDRSCYLEGQDVRQRHQRLDAIESLCKNNPPKLLPERMADLERLRAEIGFRDVRAELLPSAGD